MLRPDHLLAQPRVFPALIEELASPFLHAEITRAATVEAGGLPLGGGIAYRLNAGLVFMRKGSRIDWEVEGAVYVDLSGSEKKLQIARHAVSALGMVLVIDDGSETGGQSPFAIGLVERLGATIVGACCLPSAPSVRQVPRPAQYRLYWLSSIEHSQKIILHCCTPFRAKSCAHACGVNRSFAWLAPPFHLANEEYFSCSIGLRA